MTHIPRRILETWYLYTVESAGRSDARALPLHLIWQEDGTDCIVCAVRGSVHFLARYRRENSPRSEGSWRWEIDLAKPTAVAMNFSRLIPGLSISDETTPRLICDLKKRGFPSVSQAAESAPNLNQRLREFAWIPLPAIPTAEFARALRQIRALLGKCLVRLVADRDGFRMVARRHYDRQVSEGVEFLFSTPVHFDLEIEFSSICLVPDLIADLEDIQLWFEPEAKFVALSLESCFLMLFSAKPIVPYAMRNQHLSPTKMLSVPDEELFTGMRTVPMHMVDTGSSDESQPARSRLSFHRGVLIEACRFLMQSRGEPYVHFSGNFGGHHLWVRDTRVRGQPSGSWTIRFLPGLSDRNRTELIRVLRLEERAELLPFATEDPTGSSSVTFRIDYWHNLLELVDIISDLASVLGNEAIAAVERIEWGTSRESGNHTIRAWDVRPQRRDIQVRPHYRAEDIVQVLKDLYDNRCQVCGERIDLVGGCAYSEVHHVHPLHLGGPDIIENMLVLCPTHHKEMDLLVLAIDPDTHRILAAVPSHRLHGKMLRLSPDHVLDHSCLKFAAQRLGDPTPSSPNEHEA